MVTDEERPLIDILKHGDKTFNSTLTKYRILIVLCITALNQLGVYFYYYPRNEWLQNKIQREIFSNETVSVDKVCGEVNKSDPDYNKHDKVQQVTAEWNMYLTIGGKTACLFSTFFFTAYTDVIGRRFLFILSACSMLINSSFIATIIYFDAHPIYLVVTEIIYGITGSHYGFSAASYSYIGDLTNPGPQRSTSMYLLVAASSLGDATGAFAVGFYIQSSGYFYPTLTSAALQLVLLFLVCLVIKESLTKEKRLLRPSCLTVVKRPFDFYISNDFKSVRCAFLLLLIAFAFADMTVTHRKSTETLYQLGLPFCWTPIKIGLYATAVSLGENILGLGFLKLTQRCFTDIKIAIVSSLTNAGSLVIEGLASTSLVLYLSTVPAILNNLTPPLIRGTMSTMTSEKQQGALFASIILVQSLCSLIGGITDNSVYAATLEVFNGFIFIMLAGYCGVTILLLIMFSCIAKKDDVSSYQIQTVE